MGLDFTLYEIINYDYEKRKKGFKVKEVLYLSNATASMLVEWLYRNNCDEIPDKSDEAGAYILWYGEEVTELIDNLHIVLGATPNHKEIFALHYFPLKHTCMDYVDTCEMFSDDYYQRLRVLYDKFAGLFNGDPLDPDNNETHRRFVYNVSW